VKDKYPLVLDHYEAELGTTVWCWKRGIYSSQEFSSEDEALDAWRNDELEFSREDGGDALSDLYAREECETGYDGPYDYWLIDAFVSEPHLGGKQLGELPGFEIPQGARVLRMTQEEFDNLMEDFYMREGHYPDT
jgi:hypothetical protein